MKMTRTTCLAALAAMAAAALGAAEPVKQKVNLFEKRKEAIARRAEAIRRAGGLVDMPATGTVFRVVDGQKRIPRGTVEAHAREIEDRMRFAVSVVEPGTECVGTARIELVDDPAAPSLLVAPDVLLRLRHHRRHAALDFHDAEGHGLAQHLLHGEAELLDLRAALADDHAGPGAVDIDADLCAVPLDLDGGDAGAVKVLLQILPDLVVLDDQVADFLVPRIPAGIPVLDDAYAQTMGINFLSHTVTPFPSQRR